jgi:hypothetical protein
LGVTSASGRTETARNIGWGVRATQIGVFVAIGAAVALVNAISVNADFARRGVHVAEWEAFSWELTSWVGLTVGLAPLLIADSALARTPSRHVRAAIAIAAGAVYFAAHITTMIALRDVIYRIVGRTYDFGPWRAGLIYESRKDALVFAGALVLLWLWRRALLTPREAAPEADPAAAEPAFLADSRKGRVVIRAPEIDWVEAQGNYVALHAGGESYLIRQPLKAMDAKLRGAAFVRTHRSALVNTRRVRGIHRSDAGELRVELANQEFAPLSDRRKAAVVRALAAG